MFNLAKAQRSKSKLRLGISGSAGSGKTYSALKIAYGLTHDWSKIAVIDTERGSADLYSDLGEYLTGQINAPYTPQKYIDAIHECEESGVECIIIDSLSHCWNAEGGMLEEQNILTKKSGMIIASADVRSYYHIFRFPFQCEIVYGKKLCFHLFKVNAKCFISLSGCVTNNCSPGTIV